MPTNRSLFLAALVLCGTSAALAATPNFAPPYVEVPGDMEFSGMMIARPVQVETLVQSGVSPAEAQARVLLARSALAAYELVHYEPLVDHYVIRVPQGETENTLATSLLASGNFEYVTPNWICYPVLVPNDIFYGAQWHHVTVESAAGWDLHTGNNTTTIAICDTGVDFNHEDLQLNRKEGYNASTFFWESEGGQIYDLSPISHGTHTTGCAAANGNNNTTGVCGMGWNLGHRMLRISENGQNAFQHIIQNAALVAALKGDKPVSTSFSGVSDPSNLSVASQVKGFGSLWFRSAGNTSNEWNWGDCDADDLIVVGATDFADGKAWFSCWGPSVDLFAPGVGILSTIKGGYQGQDGTSMACPLAAGLAALMWSFNPNLTPDQIEDMIKAGCDDKGAPGKDPIFGWGRINARKTMQSVPHGKKGDLNCDDIVNFGDINPFVLALSDPNEYKKQFPNCDIANGDCNNDGKVDFGDINPFVELIGS